MNTLFKRVIKRLLIASLISVLFACGGKEERKAVYLEKGKAYLEQGNLKKAKIEFKNVLQIDPKFAQGHYFMGVVEEKNKSIKKAYALYTKASELDPTYIEPKIKLAEIYTVIGTEEYFTKAKMLVSDILAKDSKNTKAKLIKQQINYKEGNKAAALKEIERLVDEDPLLDNGINLLASAYLDQGKIDKAVSVLDKGIRADPTNLALRAKKASILFKEKRFDEAEKVMVDIINQDKSLFSSYIALSSFYSKTNQLEKAEQVLRDGIKQDVDDIKRSLVLIEFMLLRRNAEDAISELQKMIADKPDEYELHFALAKIYKSKKEYDKAKEVYQHIVNTSDNESDKVNADNLRAAMLLSEGKVSEAETLVDVTLKEHPGNNDALRLRSEISLNKKDYVTAVNDLRAVLKSQPGNTDVSKMLAQAHMALKEYELAESVLKNATLVDPTNATAFINYIGYLINQKRSSDAEKILATARKSSKKNFQLMDIALSFAGQKNDKPKLVEILNEMKKAFPNKVEVYIKRGLYYSAIKDFTHALNEFEQALAKSVLPPDAINSLEKIAKVYLVQGKPDKAIQYLKQRIAKNSKDILSQYVLANVYASQKDIANAEKFYKSVISINAKWPQPYLKLSSLYARNDRMDDAINLLEKAVKTPDADLKLHTTLATLYEQQSNFDAARKVYETILNKAPNSVLALNNLAVNLLDYSTQPGAALQALEYAKKLNVSANEAFADTLGWAYAKTGDYVKAVELLKPIVEAKPKIDVFKYHLGYALYKKGEKAAARDYLEAAVNSKHKFVGKDEAANLLKSI